MINSQIRDFYFENESDHISKFFDLSKEIVWMKSQRFAHYDDFP